jgi:hypothetical protein
VNLAQVEIEGCDFTRAGTGEVKILTRSQRNT